MSGNTEEFNRLKEIIEKEKKICKEMTELAEYMKHADVGEQRIIDSQVSLLQQSLKKANQEIPFLIEKINLLRIPGASGSEVKESLQTVKQDFTETAKRMEEKAALERNLKSLEASDPNKEKKGYPLKELRPSGLEKLTIKRMKKKEKKVENKKEQKASLYVKTANKLFGKTAQKFVSEKTFETMERDLVKANLQFTARSYISTIFLSTLVAVGAGFLIALFFFFFSITAELPILIKATGDIGAKLLRSFLIIIFAPALTFIFMYTYPGLEKTATETRIDEELPFATIHMSAISGSMIDPSKIFSIMVITHEYPYLEKEFKKLMNEINLYGYDFVSALRNSSYNSPSKKLSELFNGLATTVNSGGNLPDFFDKRSQTLLFENRLEQEKKTKSAETFMDMYISLVIAAPMILMILLMMMKISGLGISMSTKMITIVMVSAVTIINIIFLGFLQLKR